jgi:hypothetical protein
MYQALNWFREEEKLGFDALIFPKPPKRVIKTGAHDPCSMLKRQLVPRQHKNSEQH